MSKKLGSQDEHEPDLGVSALDLADLSPALSLIVRLLMRSGEMSLAEIQAAVQQLPEDSRLTDAEVDETLDTLSRRQWIMLTGDAHSPSYKVNLRRKSSNARGIWSALDF